MHSSIVSRYAAAEMKNRESLANALFGKKGLARIARLGARKKANLSVCVALLL